MSDIFDEVDDILNDVESSLDATETAATADAAENNFNEAELQDIMAEIENLEKEFETEVAEPIVVPVATLQNKIDQELEMTLKEQAPVTKVLSFEKKTPPPVNPNETVTTLKNSEISFEAHGQMNLNLGFKVGEETAKLTIDPVKGLTVTMSGVMLTLNQDAGCTVTMENGVKFTIPLTSSDSASKKKVA